MSVPTFAANATVGQIVPIPATLPPWLGGGGAGGGGFQHNQLSASASWSINHSLGRIPNVQVYVAGKVVIADVEATSTTVNITFASAQSGVAVLT